MSKFFTKNITIYHNSGNNVWTPYVLEASFRNTAYLNHTRNGLNSTENTLVRVFDVNNYNKTWFAEKGDVIVNGVADNEVTNPLTELKKIYGTDNVYKITTIDKFIFEENELKELNHIKLGAV